MKSIRLILSCILTLTLVLGGLAMADANLNEPLLFSEGEEARFDLNGDGTLETLRLEMAHRDEQDEYDTTIFATGENVDAKYVIDYMFQPSALVCDIENDGVIDVLVSGDVMSDDYYTWRLAFKGGEFALVEPEISGRAEGFADGKVILGRLVDLLGTRWCRAPFAPGANGELTKDENALWHVSNLEVDWSWTAMEIKAPLPVTMLDGDAETAALLPAGDKIYIIATDGASMAHFITEDDREGRIDVTPSERGWGFDIAGVPEDDYFVMVPYAG